LIGQVENFEACCTRAVGLKGETGVTNTPVAFAIAFSGMACSKMTNTNSTFIVTVGTVKKSIDTVWQ